MDCYSCFSRDSDSVGLWRDQESLSVWKHVTSEYFDQYGGALRQQTDVIPSIQNTLTILSFHESTF